MRRRAFTLLELVVVVLVLSILGTIVLLNTGGSNTLRQLEVASGEVAAALRFARTEAQRTSAAHGARIEVASSRIRVYRLDQSGSPFVEDYSVVHPLDKKPYDVALDGLPFAGDSKITGSQFSFAGGATLESVAFDPTGAPVSPVDLRELVTGQVDLANAGHAASVTLAASTGRVGLP